MLTGLYLPGHSWLHRIPAGRKLIVLLILTTAYVLGCAVLPVPSAAWVTVGALAVAASCYLLVFARAAPGILWAQVRPMRWFLAILVPLQWWAGGPSRALVDAGGLVVTVAAAALVTLTTPTPGVIEAVVVGIRRLGRVLPRGLRPDPERSGLLLALTLRSVPGVLGIAERHREALLARGVASGGVLDRDLVTARFVPLVDGVVRHAERMGEALAARGLDP